MRKIKTALIPLAVALAAALTITGCGGEGTAGDGYAASRDAADIAISAGTPEVDPANGTVTFHLEVTNLGPGTTADVTDVFIGTQVPPDVELVASTGPLDAREMPPVAGHTAILWPRTVVDDLEPGDTVELAATVSVPDGRADLQSTWAATGGGDNDPAGHTDLQTTWAVTGPGGTGLAGDPDPDNNTAWVTLAGTHGGHGHGPVAGPGTAQAPAPADAEAVTGYRWRHRVITWRLRSPAWTWSAAGQRQSIALAMAAWDRASSRLTLRQTSGPADIEISYQGQVHYRGNPDGSFGWNDAGHGFYPGSYGHGLGGDIHVNGRFAWGPMGSWAPLRYAVIHEIGHALGLPHAPSGYCRGSGSQVPVMCSVWPHPTQLTAWDRWALQATYGG